MPRLQQNMQVQEKILKSCRTASTSTKQHKLRWYERLSLCSWKGCFCVIHHTGKAGSIRTLCTRHEMKLATAVSEIVTAERKRHKQLKKDRLEQEQRKQRLATAKREARGGYSGPARQRTCRVDFQRPTTRPTTSMLSTEAIDDLLLSTRVIDDMLFQRRHKGSPGMRQSQANSQTKQRTTSTIYDPPRTYLNCPRSAGAREFFV